MKREFYTVEFPDKNFRFHCGLSRYKSTHTDLHSHSRDIEIHYIIKGSGEYLIEDKIYNLKEGSILIVHRNELHKMTQWNNLEQIGLYISPTIFDKYGELKDYVLENLIRCNPKYHHILQFKGDIQIQLDFLMKSILKEYSKKEASWKQSIISEIIKFCILIERFRSLGPSSPYAKTGKDIEDVLNYIGKNLTDVLSVGEIADNVGLSPNYLSTKFKKNIGINIVDYITVKRINEAKKMLESKSKEKVISIAFEVGFKELSHFNHTFKKHTGFTPSQYRQMAKS